MEGIGFADIRIQKRRLGRKRIDTLDAREDLNHSINFENLDGIIDGHADASRSRCRPLLPPPTGPQMDCFFFFNYSETAWDIVPLSGNSLKTSRFLTPP